LIAVGVAFATSLLGVGAIVMSVPTASAAAPTLPVIGNMIADMNASGGNYTGWYPAANRLKSGMTFDRNTLYTGSYYYGVGTLPTDASGQVTSRAITPVAATYNGSPTAIPPDPTGAAAGSSLWTSTIAVDANALGTRPNAYLYAWGYTTDLSNQVKTALGTSGVTGIPAKMTQGANGATIQALYRVAAGQTNSEYTAIPTPAYFGETVGSPNTYTYWSGGEVVQQGPTAGDVFFGGAELTCLATYPMMEFNPYTGDYNFSGVIQPASSADNIFGSGLASCGTGGYVASDMAVDANGNAYLLVISNTPSQGYPAGTTWMVRVTPSLDSSKAWTYELVSAMTAAPGQNAAVSTYMNSPATGGLWGMAFFNGSLYAAAAGGTQLIQINPMSGQVSTVPSGVASSAFSFAVPYTAPGGNPTFTGTGTSTTYDLASAQTAIVIQGSVFSDANDNSVWDANETVLPGQTVALYMQDPKQGNKWIYEGARVTNNEGNYSFLVGGDGNYIVRLVSPTVGGKAAWQSYAGAGGTTNKVLGNCTSGQISASGACYGALPYGSADPALTGSVAGTTPIDPSTIPMYSSISISTDGEVAQADFGVTIVADPSKSTLTLDSIDPNTNIATTKISTPSATNVITATAKILDSAGSPLVGRTVTFTNASDPVTTLSAPTCTTGSDGTCQVTIKSGTVGTYADELSATVLVGAQQANITGSPASVAFTHGDACQVGDPNCTPCTDPANPTGPKLPNTGVYIGDPKNLLKATTISLGSSQLVTGLVTDEMCNTIPDIPVTLTLSGSSTATFGSVPGTPVITASGNTDSNGQVTGTVGNSETTQTETVTVTGSFTDKTNQSMGTATVTFQLGTFSWTNSTFTVSPAVNPADTTMANWVKVGPVGGDYYTGTLTAKDDQGHLLDGLLTSDMAFTGSTSEVKVSSVTPVGNNTGQYTVQYTSTKADATTTASVTYQSTAVGSAQPIPFKADSGCQAGDPSCNQAVQAKSLLALSTDNPQGTPGTATANAVPGTSGSTNAGNPVTATVTALTSNGTPVADGTSVTFSLSSPSGSAAFSGTFTATTTNGVASVPSFTDKVAENVTVTAKVGAASAPDVTLTASVLFSPGQPNSCDGSTPETTCVCTETSQMATSMTVNPSSVTIPGSVLVSAHVTDKYCNVVADNTPVVFTVTGLNTPAPGTPFVGSGTTRGTTSTVTVSTANGDATATVSDTTAEQVQVNAKITIGTTLTDLGGNGDSTKASPQTVRFTPGSFSGKDSALVCTPTSSSTDTPVTPVANGDVTKDYWTCVITAKDDSAPTPNPLSSLNPTLFHVTFANMVASQPVMASAVTNTGNGTYTFKVSSTKAAADFTATADYDTTPVGDPQTQAAIPFKAGKICAGPTCVVTCPVNGKNWVVGQVYADPTTQAVTTATAPTSSSLSVLLADQYCNPITGATVSLQANATAPVTAKPKSTFGNGSTPLSTGIDGFAHTTISDATVETVTITGTYDASHATSSGVTGDYGSGNLRKSSQNTPPDDPLTDVVKFIPGEPCPYPCTCPPIEVAGKTVVPMGTNVTVDPSKLLVGETSVARAYITDKNCNPIPGVPVKFATTGVAVLGSSSLGTYTTDDNGLAYANVTDSQAETVTVSGTFMWNNAVNSAGSADVTFTAAPIYVQTGGAVAVSITSTMAGATGLAGLWVGIAAWRRRDEVM